MCHLIRPQKCRYNEMFVLFIITFFIFPNYFANKLSQVKIRNFCNIRYHQCKKLSTYTNNLDFCRPYIVNLLPYIARICRREEEAVQETLSNSMPKICSALMAFANDSEVKALLKSFLTNLMSPSAVCRRMAASSLSLICQYSRSPANFFTYLITVILGEYRLNIQTGWLVERLL